MSDLILAAEAAIEPVSVRKHVQIREHVRELLLGAGAGTPAPSERSLVQQFGVARMTVRQALDALVSEGLLERVPGRGTFVTTPGPVTGSLPEAPDPGVGADAGLTGFTEDMRRRGMTASSHTLLARMETAGVGVARGLEVEPGAPVVHWQRLRLADGAPMCLHDVYLSDRLVPGFLDARLPESLYDELERRGLRPTTAEDAVNAALPRAEDARRLGVDPDQPVLLLARREFAEGVLVAVSRVRYRGDRYTLWIPPGRR